MKFLVVEDNQRLSDLIYSSLREAGHAADTAATADEARHYLTASPYDLIILDLGLPDEDGSDLLRELHARRDAPPVLVATARGEINDRIHGLDLGADDYLVKPFHISELLARCRAILRRPGGALAKVLRVGDVSLDAATNELRIAGQLVAMPARELTALSVLMRRAGRVVARETFEKLCREDHREIGNNAIDAILSRLRRRLLAAGSAINVVTVRGVGYFIEDEG